MHLLFKVMNSPSWVSLGKKMAAFAFSIHLHIEWIVKKTIYKHFCGGVSIMDSSNLIDKLDNRNVGTKSTFTLSYFHYIFRLLLVKKNYPH